MKVEITEVLPQADNLIVRGLVDGVPTKGHGWVSRYNHIEGEANQRAYVEGLLVAGLPADAATLQKFTTKPRIRAKVKAYAPYAAIVAAAAFDVLMHLLWR